MTLLKRYSSEAKFWCRRFGTFWRFLAFVLEKLLLKSESINPVMFSFLLFLGFWKYVPKHPGCTLECFTGPFFTGPLDNKAYSFLLTFPPIFDTDWLLWAGKLRVLWQPGGCLQENVWILPQNSQGKVRTFWYNLTGHFLDWSLVSNQIYNMYS